MPVIRNPLLNTPSSGNEAIDALVSFLRGSPEDPLTDLANPLAPAVGMAVRSAKGIIPVIEGMLKRDRNWLKKSRTHSPMKMRPGLLRRPDVVLDSPSNIRQRDWEGEWGKPGGTPMTPVEDLEKLKKSISEEGIKEPVTIEVKPGSGEVEIIDGTHRLMLAEELGMETVPVHVSPSTVQSSPDASKDGINSLLKFVRAHADDIFFEIE